MSHNTSRIVWITGQANWTSDVFPSNAGRDEDVFVLISGSVGTGEVRIEFKDPDGTFRAFPETTFTTTAAQAVRIPNGIEWQAVIDAATNVNLEIRR